MKTIAIKSRWSSILDKIRTKVSSPGDLFTKGKQEVREITTKSNEELRKMVASFNRIFPLTPYTLKFN